MTRLIAIVAAVCCCQFASGADVITVEAERGELHGVEAVRDGQGYTGDGYVRGFDADGDTLSFTVKAEAGIYDVIVRYRTFGGKKGFGLAINGETFTGMFPAAERFTDHTMGKVELAGGDNRVTITKGWGYFAIDSLTFRRSEAMPKPRPVPPKPCNPEATPEAQALLAYLAEGYGERVLSGQQDLPEVDLVEQLTGRSPAIVGIDLMDYSPSRVEHGTDPAQLVERAIERAQRGHLVTVAWHWNAPTDLMDKTYTNEQGETIEAPWWRGFYTNATTFDVAAALADPQGEDYALLLRDIDAIAVELRKFADAGVPVLWRPLHEAEGGWFWWGTKGAEPFTQLWRLLYDRLTHHHGLNNLLWVFTGEENADWYPGDAYVDVIGVDAYPDSYRDPLTGKWETLQRTYGGRKLVALTEFGGVPDVERMRRFGVWFAYFLPWAGDLGPRKVPQDFLQTVYDSPSVITRDELPQTFAETPE